MVQEKIAPAVQSVQAGTKTTQLVDKDSKKMLPLQQRRLLAYLYSSTHPQSVADISVALHQSDPRGHIAYLRRKGFPIGDVWCKSPYGSRYKRYFIRKEVSE